MTDTIADAIARMFETYDAIPGIASGHKAIMENRFAYAEIGEEAMGILDGLRTSLQIGLASSAPKMTEIGGAGVLSVNDAYMLTGLSYVSLGDRKRLGQFIGLVPKLAEALVEMSKAVGDRDGLSNHAEIMVDVADEILAQPIMRCVRG